MARVRVVLFDTGIVFRLHEFGLWGQVLERYEVSVPATVVAEAEYYLHAGEKVYIDLAHHVASGRLTIVEVPASEVVEFRSGFRPLYGERLDPGEAEMLAFTMRRGCIHRVCSADAIVFKAGRSSLGSETGALRVASRPYEFAHAKNFARISRATLK